jgi:hypothetical protein
VGLCGPVVPLSSGAPYESQYADSDNGMGGTALGTDCPTVSPTTITPTITGQTWTPTTSPNTLEDYIEYQACIVSPSTCTELCVPPLPVAVPSPVA